LEQAMFGVSAKELRENSDIREDVKAHVDEILGRMSF